MSIYINVVNQKLLIASSFDNVVSGSQEFVKFTFNLANEWDDLTAFAQFQQSGVAYNVYLDENNSAYLPPEIGAGTCTLMLYGSGGKTIATTNYLTLKVDSNILVSDAQSTEISESLYQQLVDKVDNFITQKDEVLTAKLKEELQNFIDEGVLGNITIGDGTLSRAKVDSSFEATLAKADNSASKTDIKNMVEFVNSENTMKFELAEDGGLKLIIAEREEQI